MRGLIEPSLLCGSWYALHTENNQKLVLWTTIGGSLKDLSIVGYFTKHFCKCKGFLWFSCFCFFMTYIPPCCSNSQWHSQASSSTITPTVKVRAHCILSNCCYCSIWEQTASCWVMGRGRAVLPSQREWGYGRLWLISFIPVKCVL